MARLHWGEIGSRLFETGVDRGVLYPAVGPGVPWNGLTSVTEDTDDIEQNAVYVDGKRYLTQVSLSTFSATLNAITYPDEFEKYDGFDDDGFSAQNRETFNFSYRTLIGNDVESSDYAYKIHLVYNALASPTNRIVKSLNSENELAIMSWGITTTPVEIPGFRNSAHLIIDSTKIYPDAFVAIENLLYGTIDQDPQMPPIGDLLDLFESYAILRVVDNGDGTATITGPDEAVYSIGPTESEIDWPSVIQIATNTFTISSL